ncbi:DUF6877 family protein [Ligilactobacillus salivarius]|uniref:DUF6877 family protein n=1 Tax=Ligilactobacillus salivarius TaxID=1624 RepID=UPI002B49EE8D|nr:DUF6877 family protein [Ligilactobacillus salivarius]
MDNKVTAIDRLAELIREYAFPLDPLVDVIWRISSWQGSTSDDPYLWQQVRYLEKLVRKGHAVKKNRN